MFPINIKNAWVCSSAVPYTSAVLLLLVSLLPSTGRCSMHTAVEPKSTIPTTTEASIAVSTQNSAAKGTATTYFYQMKCDDMNCTQGCRNYTKPTPSGVCLHNAGNGLRVTCVDNNTRVHVEIDYSQSNCGGTPGYNGYTVAWPKCDNGFFNMCVLH